MPKIPLRVVSEPPPGTTEVINREGRDTAVYHGSDIGHDYVCGQCGAILMAGMQEGQIQHTVIKCGACGALNATEP